VQHARDQRLIRHTLFERPDLNVTQVARGQADVDPAILDGRGARRRLELGKFGLAGNGFELPLFIGADSSVPTLIEQDQLVGNYQ
jgi:hypothetical protein